MSHYGCHACQSAYHCRCTAESIEAARQRWLTNEDKVKPFQQHKYDESPANETVMWSLNQGLDLIRDLQPQLIKVHWNVALAGGVLYKGQSAKDLDLVFFPYDTSKARIYRLQDKLEDQGWTRTHTVEQMWARWRATGITDRKHVEVYRTDMGQRIDAIILGGLG